MAPHPRERAEGSTAGPWSRRGTGTPRELRCVPATVLMAPAFANFAKTLASARSARGGAWIACPWVAVAPVLLAACSGGAAGPEGTATTSSAIYGGVEDDDAQQNASVVALEIGDGTTFTLCSGSLIATNVVLTARHCVSTLTSTAAAEVSCDDEGGSTNGPDFAGDVDVSTVHVFVGPSIYEGETPTANAKAFYHPSGTTLCNADLALVVLDTSVTSVAPLRVRMTSPVATGETVRAVGFGENDQNQPIGTRFRKDDIPVLAVGATISASGTPLGGSEFELGESTCEGDSGGPAIDEKSGAIVGVVSRGQSDCSLNYGHVYTSLGGFVPLFQAAFAAAGGTWTDEDGSSGPGDGGSPSADAGDVAQSSPGTGAGPGGSSGGSAGDVNLHAGQGSSCAAAVVSRGPSGEGFLAGAIALLTLVIARRRSW
jgi:hypothetical protein